jgi:hypothetical protein
MPPRRLDLDDLVPGTVLLSAMPGRDGAFGAWLDALRAAGVRHVACLTGPAEIARLSPDYAAWRRGDAALTVHEHPVQDFGVPGDAAAFAAFVAGLAALLRAGEGVAIHCAGGVGRTGLTAVCLLTALGLGAEAARARVEAAGSHPETEAQAAFASAFAERGPL